MVVLMCGYKVRIGGGHGCEIGGAACEHVSRTLYQILWYRLRAMVARIR